MTKSLVLKPRGSQLFGSEVEDETEAKISALGVKAEVTRLDLGSGKSHVVRLMQS